VLEVGPPVLSAFDVDVSPPSPPVLDVEPPSPLVLEVGLPVSLSESMEQATESQVVSPLPLPPPPHPV